MAHTCLPPLLDPALDEEARREAGVEGDEELYQEDLWWGEDSDEEEL